MRLQLQKRSNFIYSLSGQIREQLEVHPSKFHKELSDSFKDWNHFEVNLWFKFRRPLALWAIE